MDAYEVEGVEHLGNGKYKIYVELGTDNTGKRRRRTKTVTPTSERNLKKLKREFELKCMQEMDEPIDNMTFGTFVIRWKKNHVAHLKQNTRLHYDTVLNSNTLDHFKNMKLKEIKRMHVIEFLDEQETMKADKLKVLKSIFWKAVEWEVINKNPIQRVKLPATKSKKVRYYNEDELNHLFKVLEECNDKDRVTVKLAAIGGLRRSEILGIREENLDFENNSIYIDKQLIYDDEKKEFYLDTLKNSTPRTVYFPDDFMSELKSYYIKFKQLRMGMGNLWKGIYDKEGKMINLIFVKGDGMPVQPVSFSGHWRELVERFNLKPISFHDLRHSCASLMVKKGINFKVIQERLGHKTISVTLDLYSHLDDEQHRESVTVFEDIL